VGRELSLQPTSPDAVEFGTDGHVLEYLQHDPGGHHLVSRSMAERAQIKDGVLSGGRGMVSGIFLSGIGEGEVM
jgi:hypothetical protein